MAPGSIRPLAIRLEVYAPQWLRERPEALQPRTLELYGRLLSMRIYPAFGRLYLSKITPSAVRSWHAGMREDGVGETTIAKSYRLLKAILNTAVDDELIAKKPCRLRRAGLEHPLERKRRHSRMSTRSLMRSSRGIG